MKIDKNLNLVIPIYGDDDSTVRAYVHSTPIAREVFEKYFMTIAQTFASIYGGGLGQLGGPPVAMLLLKQQAEKANAWDGPEGINAGLVEEIRRMTSVIVPGEPGKGWQPLPLQVAVDRGFLNPDDKAEVENAIVFFIVVSAMHNRAVRRPILEGAVDLWGAQISSLNSSAFAASLATSTATGNSGEKSPAPANDKPAGANAVVDGKPASVPA